MRRSWILLPLALTLSLGAKKPKNKPAETPPAEATSPASETPAAEPVAEPEPEPPTPPVVVSNVDFKATVSYADNTKKAGHVKRLERSSDWFGEAEWSTDTADLVITLVTGTTDVVKPFTDIKNIQITPGKPSQDVDCNYDSDFSPWMYDCTLKNATKVTTRDGKTWSTETRYKWRLTFDDDTEAEFWLAKYPVRMQDTQATSASENAEENTAMYEELQVRLYQEVKKLVTGVAFQ